MEYKSTNDETSTPNETIHKHPQPDGGYGWLVMIAATIIATILHIVLYSFSVFYIEFTDSFQKSKAEIGILLSLIYFFLFGIGKYTVRAVLFCCVLFCYGYFSVIYFTNKELNLAQG